MSHQYLVESLEGFVVGDALSLDGSEARHARDVVRMRLGEKTLAGDGRGTIAEIVITELSSSYVRGDIVALHKYTPPQPELVLVQALTKGDRAERAIEACTELGVNRIIPWQAERCVSRWNVEKASKGRQRWQQIVREATKQSVQPFLPVVADLHSSQNLVDELNKDFVIVLDPESRQPLSDLDIPAQSISRVVFLIGPEGGMSETELDLFNRAGFTSAVLGSSVLRTSTAAVSAASVLSVLLGRWGGKATINS